MKINLDSHEYVCYTYGLCNYQNKKYETCLVILLLSYYIEKSYIGIPLVLFGICFRGGVRLC
jgi:hypothetical protein